VNNVFAAIIFDIPSGRRHDEPFDIWKSTTP
jgi:hypothetical protein